MPSHSEKKRMPGAGFHKLFDIHVTCFIPIRVSAQSEFNTIV